MLRGIVKRRLPDLHSIPMSLYALVRCSGPKSLRAGRIHPLTQELTAPRGVIRVGVTGAPWPVQSPTLMRSRSRRGLEASVTVSLWRPASEQRPRLGRQDSKSPLMFSCTAKGRLAGHWGHDSRWVGDSPSWEKGGDGRARGMAARRLPPSRLLGPTWRRRLGHLAITAATVSEQTSQNTQA